MPSEPLRAGESFFDVSDADIAKVLDAHGGNGKAAVRALLIREADLERRISGLMEKVSNGFIRLPRARLKDVQG
ncbi:MAG: hypothetical protein AB1592_19290 [Pseudomonadota bacterium]